MKEKKRGSRYHIPPSAEVARAIINVMKSNPVVSSQQKMLWLVLRDLREKDSMYTLTGERLRHIAVETGRVTVETEARETSRRRNVLRCPVCGHPTDVVKNQTLYGGTVSLVHRCPRCGYWTGIRFRLPTRYRFLLKGEAGRRSGDDGR